MEFGDGRGLPDGVSTWCRSYQPSCAVQDKDLDSPEAAELASAAASMLVTAHMKAKSTAGASGDS